MDPLPPFNQKSSFSYTLPPNPEWKFGDGLVPNNQMSDAWKADESEGYKVFDPSKEESSTIYKLMTSGIIPRPIAFVSSLSSDGVPNLAPFSYFSMCNHNPAMISVSVNARRDVPKDTAKNIMETKEFTVSIIGEPFIEAASWTSVESPDTVDEWVGSGLTREPSTLVKPPRVRESAFSMECELYQSVPLANPATPDKPTSYLLIGLVKLIHVRNAVLDENKQKVDPHKYRAVSRLGDITFARVGEGFRIPRPQWDEVKKQYEQIQQ
ncbi:hypothetical protein CPB86DRAFT_714039 [Serendipita vermifera]|nr:hypothetical protein CPB86DRAFT_714039 [Serendipita vermifera]